MTQEEKQLLIKDLCARLPYGVRINISSDYTSTMECMELNAYHLAAASYNIEYRGLRPYLRSMSSMTEEEKEEWDQYVSVPDDKSIRRLPYCAKYIDWLTAHHFDYHRLIQKGLALEAPEGMYKTE